MNVLTQQMAVAAERGLVQGQAERGWRATEARAAGGHTAPSRVGRARWLAGMLLLRAGTRLQGTARTKPVLPTAAA